MTATFEFDQYLGQHNQGNHTALYGDVDQYLAGKDVPIPIVGPGARLRRDRAGPDGCFKGWAMFHVISASRRQPEGHPRLLQAPGSTTSL